VSRTNTIVIGAGQAGLAASHCLAELGIDHVVLERGRVGERWRSERWPSLTMQTPRWQSRLPGWRYAGPEPDGYMSMPELIGFLEGYARSFAAPVHEGVTVRSVRPDAAGYRVDTDAGRWSASHVIIATGHCDVPTVPGYAPRMPREVHQLVPTRYRSPRDLPAGGVLVVGASASGVQLADELRRAGREVTLAVGGHTRLPRRHLGRDILWWLDQMGVLDQRASEVRDLAAARRQPSMQLVGDGSGRSLDLVTLQRAGVRLVGRARGVEGGTLVLGDDLVAKAADADARARRILARADALAAARGIVSLGPPATIEPVRVDALPARLDLAGERISTVIWATGFARAYPWLDVPGTVGVDGELVHDGGITPAPGLYAVGMRFQRRRNSSFLDGVGGDAHAVTSHLAARLGLRAAA
jgi:putative flavoprotein involved in K+ transport